MLLNEHQDILLFGRIDLTLDIIGNVSVCADGKEDCDSGGSII